MASNQRMVKPGLAVAVAATVIVAATGCSKNTSSSTGGSSSAATASATASPSTGMPSGPSTSATASARFVGKWTVHDASLDITPTTATLVASLGAGPCSQDPQVPCSETDTLAVASGNDTQLTLTVTAVSYTLHSGQTTSVNPTGPSTAVGDSIQLVSQAPGLLKETVLQGFPDWQGGNPYWCGNGISEDDQTRCGA